jgi:intermediate cleaving peptidase 55
MIVVHINLLGFSKVTPEISAQEYHDRRERLANLLPPNSVALLPSSVVKYRSGPVFHKFHQDSNFFYLTGLASRYWAFF